MVEAGGTRAGRGAAVAEEAPGRAVAAAGARVVVRVAVVVLVVVVVRGAAAGLAGAGRAVAGLSTLLR